MNTDLDDITLFFKNEDFPKDELWTCVAGGVFLFIILLFFERQIHHNALFCFAFCGGMIASKLERYWHIYSLHWKLAHGQLTSAELKYRKHALSR